METEKVTVLLWDSLKNFDENKTNWGFYNGESNIFRDVKQFQSEEEFKKIISDTKPESELVFCCHVNLGNLKEGFYLFRNSRIEQKLNIPDVYYISSGGDEAENTLRNESAGKIIVRQYNDFERDVRLGKIKTFKKSELSSIPPSLSSNVKKGVFLSHSSKDIKILKKFRDLILVGGLGVNLNDILLTTDEATAIKAGRSIPEEISHFLKNRSGLFIQFISDDYIKSRVCLNEEGAAWVLHDETNYITIILSGFTTSDITWVKTVDKGIKIENKNSLMNIYNDRKEFFKNVNVTHFSNKIEEFLEFLKSAS